MHRVTIQKIYIFASAFTLLFALVLLNGQTLKAALSIDTLKRHQADRDVLFKTLSASATNYTFKYVVINLPAGAVPGKNFPIPVSHIRYESTVFFDFDQFALRPNAEPIIRDLAGILLKDLALRSLLIVGHTDSTGTDEYNLTLSKKRAFTVATRLQAAGVNGSYIRIIPMGKEQPFATNSTPEGRALNRRVEFFISDVPEATVKAVQLIPFNPCFRNDQNEVNASATGCDNTPRRIPVFSVSSDSRPTGQFMLKAKPLERPTVPVRPRERPSLQQLENSNPAGEGQLHAD